MFEATGSGKHFGGFRGLDGPNSLVVGGWWNHGRMVMMVITICINIQDGITLSTEEMESQ